MKPKYRNPFEKATGTWLTKRGIGFAYERVKISFPVPVKGGFCPSCNSILVYKHSSYLVDFSFDPANYKFYVETKGRLISESRTRFLALQQEGHDIRFVFQRDNKLSPRSKKRYSDWAKKYGFKYSMGLPDPKWFGNWRK